MIMQYPGFNPNEPEKEASDVTIVQKIEAKIGVPWKSIYAFLGIFFGQLLARATVNGIPVFPETLQGWSSLIIGSLLGAGVVYFKGNIYTEPQAEKKLEQAQKLTT